MKNKGMKALYKRLNSLYRLYINSESGLGDYEISDLKSVIIHCHVYGLDFYKDLIRTNQLDRLTENFGFYF